jgi:hypothetical protein
MRRVVKSVNQLLVHAWKNKAASGQTALETVTAVCTLLVVIFGSSSCDGSVLGISVVAFACTVLKNMVVAIMYFKDTHQRREVMSNTREAASNSREAVELARSKMIVISTVGSNQSLMRNEFGSEIARMGSNQSLMRDEFGSEIARMGSNQSLMRDEIARMGSNQSLMCDEIAKIGSNQATIMQMLANRPRRGWP